MHGHRQRRRVPEALQERMVGALGGVPHHAVEVADRLVVVDAEEELETLTHDRGLDAGPAERSRGLPGTAGAPRPPPPSDDDRRCSRSPPRGTPCPRAGTAGEGTSRAPG